MESIRSIPLSHRLAISRLLHEGSIGWHAEARADYHQYAFLASIRDIILKLGGSNRVNKIHDFEEMFPTIDRMSSARRDPRSVFEQLESFRQTFSDRS